MAFIRLADEEGLTVHVVVAQIAYVAAHPFPDQHPVGSEIGFGVVGSLYFRESPDQILAAIAEAEGAPAGGVTDAMVRAAVEAESAARTCPAYTPFESRMRLALIAALNVGRQS